jgi:hypothetical protein
MMAEWSVTRRSAILDRTWLVYIPNGRVPLLAASALQCFFLANGRSN